MARYTGSACKLCRREGCKLFLKGDRCMSDKCALNRRATVPGQHGTSRARPTEYALHLREKQKARRYYGVLEKQFVNYYETADNMEGISGENLLAILERRFDNVVYRMGLANSRKEARQLVNHGHFTINGKKANIPSIILRVGDTVALAQASRSSSKLKELLDGMTDRPAPKWLDVDKDAASAKVAAIPSREDIDFELDEQLIIEFYSK